MPISVHIQSQSVSAWQAAAHSCFLRVRGSVELGGLDPTALQIWKFPSPFDIIAVNYKTI